MVKYNYTKQKVVIKTIFFIADTHFCQDKLLQYGKRPFNSVEEMNSIMISNWNKKVSKEDMVFMLGDFSFGTVQETQEICKQLNGTKYLVKGNWDIFKFDKTWEEIGFQKVLEEPYELYVVNEDKEMKVILSHHPVEIPENEFNIHGHLHLDDLEIEFPNIKPDNHYCVSVERIGYTPISLEEILNKKGEI